MYTTPAEVKIVLAAINSDADDDYQGTPAELSDNIIQLCIDDAEAQIDTALNKIYKVPFDPVPNLIVSIARAIACYLADLTYRKSRAYDNPAFYAIPLRYDWAKKQLDMLQYSQISLNGDSDTDPWDTSIVIHAYCGPLFTQAHYLKPSYRYVGDY